jgi:hypothetical protein
MKQKEDLYHLIQAMSKSEKRYFTIDAKKSGRNSSKYLELFQSINQMEVYNEQKLQKKFGKTLPFDKSYLYDAILRSMRDYRSSKSRAARIKEMILDTNYLYERGLYQQSEERLKQARGLAEELDDQLALLEISREQLNHAWVTKPKDYGLQIKQLLEEKDLYIHHINEELQYLALCYQIQMAKNQTNADKKQFLPTLFDEDQYPSAAHAQRRFLQSCALYFDLIGQDIEKANKYYSRMVEWWDQYPAIKEEEYTRYLADFFNLLHNSYHQKNYQQFKRLLEHIGKETPTSRHDQELLFKQKTNYQLLYHINFGVEEGHEDLLNQVSEGLSTFKLNPVSQLIIVFNITILLFILDRHDQCIEWCDKVLKQYNRKVNSEQIQLSTLLLNMLCNLSRKRYRSDGFEFQVFTACYQAIKL